MTLQTRANVGGATLSRRSLILLSHDRPGFAPASQTWKSIWLLRVVEFIDAMEHSVLNGPLRLDGQVRMLVQFHVESRIVQIKFLSLIDGLFSRMILWWLILIVERLVEMGCLIIGDASGALSLHRVYCVVCEVLWQTSDALIVVRECGPQLLMVKAHIGRASTKHADSLVLDSVDRIVTMLVSFPRFLV